MRLNIVDYTATSDEDLMLAYQKGDNHAFEVLLGRHQTGIYNFLYRYMGQGENVEEAFQEVFVRLIRSAHSYTPTAKFTTWLYTIARNYSIDQSRKAKFRKTISLSEPIDKENGINYEDAFADEQALPADQASALDLTKIVQEILESINPDQKEVFLLREQQGMSFEEIAQVVGSSVNTVKSRMRYALTSIKEELKKLEIIEP